MAYVMREKVQISRNLLKYSNRPVAVIAEYMNLSPQSYFTEKIIRFHLPDIHTVNACFPLHEPFPHLIFPRKRMVLSAVFRFLKLTGPGAFRPGAGRAFEGTGGGKSGRQVQDA